LTGFWRGISGGLLAAVILAVFRKVFLYGEMEVEWVNYAMSAAFTALWAAGYPLQVLLRHMRPGFAIAVVTVVSQASFIVRMLQFDLEYNLLTFVGTFAPGLLINTIVAASASGMLAPRAQGEVRISKSFFVAAWSIAYGIPLLLIGLLVITLSVLVHKMLSAIPGGHSRTTPGRAVGLMFMPLYNLYWLFQVFPGWATDYDTYVTDHKLDAPSVSGNVFTVYCILVLAAAIPGIGLIALPINFFVGLVMIARMCDAITPCRRTNNAWFPALRMHHRP
jgi:hypothetical protein